MGMDNPIQSQATSLNFQTCLAERERKTKLSVSPCVTMRPVDIDCTRVENTHFVNIAFVTTFDGLPFSSIAHALKMSGAQTGGNLHTCSGMA